ncbi:dihydrolipoamide acetyltransferase family protein [Dactylosporangium sp. NPDC050688]|uniref:dihydrolipoamide acetyltransferase family protein n=1 Tax=Dactylosporangium sp. NPDC050688 TaxID=3157217 RepID=UPI0033F3FF6E
MSIEVYLPRIGSTTMSSGIVVAWLVEEGEQVEADQPLVEIETDKTNIEVPSPGAGVLLRIVAKPGDEVPVGDTIGYIGAPGEVVTDPGVPAPPAPAAMTPPLVEPVETTTVAPGPADSVRAVPAARRRAAELGVDIASVRGTGPNGRVRVQDVVAASSSLPQALADTSVVQPKAQPPVETGTADATGAVQPKAQTPVEPGTAGTALDARRLRVRRATARRMAESSGQVAAVTLTREVDLTATLAAIAELRRADDATRSKAEKKSGKKSGKKGGKKGGKTARKNASGPGVLDLVMVASATALLRHPEVNAAYSVESGVVPSDGVHLGFAVQTDAGLFVPTLRDAAGLAPVELWQRRRELTGRALTDTLGPDELGGSSFTVSNLGPFGVDVFTPIVNLPEVAVLGVGRTRQGVIGVDGMPVVRPLMWLSLTFDHRAIDGAPAAAFLGDVAALLEHA